ncbi:hypothetical protein PanWU01x14_029000 [Parasponia andersonii]|uniref:Uncharacterized protein n=1 Tax=Parasponia andersonii TaxID=3476 RepID=A0A2P5DVI1_PARAD|nr:hypothetical protein PanWU01x14_029000 [Parasponia andersonii]
MSLLSLLGFPYYSMESLPVDHEPSPMVKVEQEEEEEEERGHHVLKTLPPPPPPPLTPFQWDDNSLSQLGFGYDSLTNDFKVVKFCGAYDTGKRCGYSNLFKRCAQVGVYSVGSNSWKLMEMPNLFTSELDSVDSSFFDVVATPNLTCSVVVNNSIRWMLRFHPSKELNHYSFGIVAFDLNTEDPTGEGTANSTLTSE